MTVDSSSLKASVVQRFHHNRPAITSFDGFKIETPENLLTLVVRTDTNFATRTLQNAFVQSGRLATRRSLLPGSPLQIQNLFERVYKTWGTEVVSAVSDALDYESRYDLSQTRGQTNIHFHSADSLAGSVIQKAGVFLEQTCPEAPAALFISLDDMIHDRVFHSVVKKGNFAEIGFSRLFSLAGEEVDHVARPGHPTLPTQLDKVRKALIRAGGSEENPVPIVLLEDNVRRAKTLLWIFDKMKERGLFQHGRVACVATCFSVATKEEKEKILCQGQKVPLLVGVDYAGSLVDVITPRDHFFDGFVVQCRGKYGRLPSFMFPTSKVAEQFKLEGRKTAQFMDRVIDANINFCRSIKSETGHTLTLSDFVPGPTMAYALNVSPHVPMVEILKRKARERKGPSLRLV